MGLTPLPPSQTFPSSPSSPRKRSIHEVDGTERPSVGPKKSLLDFTGENQENHDPSGPTIKSDSLSFQNDPSATIQSTPNSAPQVIIPFKSDPSLSGSPVHFPSPIPNPAVETPQGSPVKSDMAPGKKRKLSPSVKEAKERLRLEEKAKKDEEKRLKDEEKKKRETEREEEKRLKEEEKKKRETEREEKKKAKDQEKAAKEAAKEDEKRRKEEAQQKKDRAQPKLNSFFGKPRQPTEPVKTAALSSNIPSTGSDTNVFTLRNSDYAKDFPDFFLKSNTVVAPPHRFERDSEALAHVRHTIDASFCSNDNTPYEIQPFVPSTIFNLVPYRRRQGRYTHSVKEILQTMQNLEDAANQLGGEVKEKSIKASLDELRQIPMKSLKFGEDVRPAYQGTFSKQIPILSANKVSRNPYHRGLPDVNYDYDSEVEWEEPEEGEELDSEEEEEASDDGEDDMDGFLDDEDDALAGKRRMIVGDLEPVCSGLHWAADGPHEEFKVYQIETISESVRFPIDPFSTAYWEKPRAVETAQKARVTQKPTPIDLFRVQNTVVPSGSGVTIPPPPPPAFKAKKPFPPEQLAEFKTAVEGSDLSKIGLVEILKKRFPKVSKETLKATLDQVAVRVGQKEVDKKWTCR
ncbi:uncharacterized protein N7483_000886 [Penicillium malachiteum]|uniref:uncharacterized protein n=1 Tax=Penicillium malachiteum TaxID=1324776 RepID=UPI002547E2C0|nr:uncharacterized protein N7483_000886 [Penicillium malachiteum]KAJ5735761.1 hypothetical protein N7483_000886 [Penicillium malachiteum]